MPQEASPLQLDHFIHSVLKGELASKFKYEYFPWPLWPENINKPGIKNIHEPKLPYFNDASLGQSLAYLGLSKSTRDLQVVENIPPTQVSTKHIVVYQSKTEGNRLLKVTFQEEPSNDLFQAHQLLCFIMGTSVYNYYQAQLR